MRQLGAIHFDGALAAVVVQHQFGLVHEVAIAFHEVGQGHVAVRSLALGPGDAGVPAQFGVVGQAAQGAQERVVQVGVAGGEDVGDDQGTCVDKRVARNAFFSLQLHHGVERRTGRLAAHALPQVIAHGLERQHEGEQLGNALQRERRVRIAHAVGAAVHQRHGHAELARRHGDYAIVGLAAQAALQGDGFADLRLGYFAAGDKPVLAKAAGKLIDVANTPALLAEASVALSDELDPHEDQQATSAMRRHLAKVLLARCVATLLNRPDLKAGGRA